MGIWPQAGDTQELLAEVRARQSGAIDRLLDRHHTAVRRMVSMRIDPQLQRRVDASDVMQEVMIEANRDQQLASLLDQLHRKERSADRH